MMPKVVAMNMGKPRRSIHSMPGAGPASAFRRQGPQERNIRGAATARRTTRLTTLAQTTPIRPCPCSSHSQPSPK